MTHQHKRVVASLSILALIVWPIGHQLLVRRYDVNPWKLLGFAMYTTVHTVKVEIVDETAREPHRLPLRSLSEKESRALRKFNASRLIFGRFSSPRHLAQVVFEANSAIKRLSIIVVVTQLDGTMSTLERRVNAYQYSRLGTHGSP